MNFEAFRKNHLLKRSLTAGFLTPVMLLITYFGDIYFTLFYLGISYLALQELRQMMKRNRKYWKHWFFSGVFFITFFFLNMIAIRYKSLNAALMLLFIVWTTDTAAYFSGILIGGRKLAPKISPNKTLSGFIGGIICACFVGIMAHVSDFLQFADELHKSILSVMLISMCSQAGDLMESALKRYFDVKDSGKFLPGHGGVLDRFDGMIFASFAMAALVLN